MSDTSTHYIIRRGRKARRSLSSLLVGAAIQTFTWISEKIGSSRRLSRRLDREFAETLSDSLFFVFGEADGSIEQLPSSEYKNKRFFDNARAIVHTPLLRLHFQKVRGQLEVEAASLKRPFEWEDVGTLLNWLDTQQSLERQIYSNFSDDRLRQVDDFLRTNWMRLCEAVEAQKD
jgi:hypothetical protein